MEVNVATNTNTSNYGKHILYLVSPVLYYDLVNKSADMHGPSLLCQKVKIKSVNLLQCPYTPPSIDQVAVHKFRLLK